MGSEFWWFYDVLAVAAAGVCIFISGKKGVLKAFTSLFCFILALGVAYGVSDTMSQSIYTNTVKNSNYKKLCSSVNNYKLAEKISENLTDFGYGGRIDRTKIQKILESKKPIDDQIYKYFKDLNVNSPKPIDSKEEFVKKLQAGYSEIVKGIVSDQLSKYSAECAADKVLKEPQTFYDLVPLLIDKEDQDPAAMYIAENYTAQPYTYLIRLFIFVIMFVIVVVVSEFIVSLALTAAAIEQSLISNIFGGLIGILKGAAVVLVIAAAVRLYVIMGSNEMLFFNHEAIDKTYIFRYAYDIVVDKL